MRKFIIERELPGIGEAGSSDLQGAAQTSNAALAELTFSKRRISSEVKKVLQAAIANAENNHQLDVDRLFVAEASVGKAIVMKRFRPRARGRAGRIMKPFSHLTVVVREREETA